MASPEVKILGSWQSPYALRARVALNIKSVPYELQQEQVLVAKSDLLLKLNPIYKKIPVLIHNDMSLCESPVIVQYIDEVWASGPAILPSDPYDRAVARFWTNYIDVKWAPYIRANLAAEDEEEAKKIQDETIEGLVLLDDAFTKCSNGHKFFGGHRIGYVDIALGCFLPWIAVVDKWCNISLIDESKTPNLFKWAQHFSADAAVKDIIPNTEQLFEFAKFLVSVMKASQTK